MKLNLVGIPSYAGALYSGTELTPAHLRAAGLAEALRQRGMAVHDLGDLPMAECQPRHNVPPVRNWPAPRMVWEAIDQAAGDWFAPDTFALLVGGDCSIVNGTASHLARRFGENLYLIVVDAHVDAVQPGPTRCLGAAASGLWFLACDSPLWAPPALPPSHMLVAGVQNPPAETYGIGTVSLEQLRAAGMREAARSILRSLPADARILVHFDVDVMGKADMPAAYAPMESGLSAAECQDLLGELLSDTRVLGMEVTEFSALRDGEGTHAHMLIGLLAAALAERPR